MLLCNEGVMGGNHVCVCACVIPKYCSLKCFQAVTQYSPSDNIEDTCNIPWSDL